MEAHNHSLPIAADQAGTKAFKTGIVLNMAFVIIEVFAGLITDSMSLLTDAGHNLSDVSSLFISFLAFKLAKKKATEKYTYGYKKTTVVAAFINAVILMIALGVIGYESVSRLLHPQFVKGNQIAWVAAIGIAVNGISAFLFFKDKERDLNVKGAYLHLLADALVSLGVVVAGVVISYTDWFWLDPVTGLVIIAVVVFSTGSLLKDSFNMSIDAVPEGVDIGSIKNKIKSIDGVIDFYHIHVWPLSTTENALTAHLVADDTLSFSDKTSLVKKVKHELIHCNIQHSTIELD
jgi:cobalt-zinc-cadmium efflux system protein